MPNDVQFPLPGYLACSVCGTAFLARADARTCSDRCRMRAYRERIRRKALGVSEAAALERRKAMLAEARRQVGEAYRRRLEGEAGR